MTHAGFVALAGRPNAGKSTLLNQIVGAKVAITSPRPQTTRRAIRGVATGSDWQLVVVDLPGVQRPRDPLTERMQRRMDKELRDSDAALFVVNGHETIGPGDRFIAEAIKGSGLPTVTGLNKVDLLNRAQIVERLHEVAEFGVQGEIYPVSAKTGGGIRDVVRGLVELMPESPLLYPPDEKTDLSLEVRLAEIVREQILHRTHDEIPHAVEVQVDETGPVAGPRELGDVVICEAHTRDLTEAAVHGVLHLCGYDHETDDGEMLALQERVLAGLVTRS